MLDKELNNYGAGNFRDKYQYGYMNYLYLKNGGKLFVVPGLTYLHRVDNHEGEEQGHYVTNNHKTGNFHQEVENMLKFIR